YAYSEPDKKYSIFYLENVKGVIANKERRKKGGLD
ncbi:hypothetical protein MBGDF03_01213, partial [Thermoplasmatales archaeon SCGC AB-540-F20]